MERFAPLVMVALEEVDRATENPTSTVTEVKKDMMFTFDEKASVPVVEQRAEERR
jgi:hypothetical protein